MQDIVFKLVPGLYESEFIFYLEIVTDVLICTSYLTLVHIWECADIQSFFDLDNLW